MLRTLRISGRGLGLALFLAVGLASGTVHAQGSDDLPVPRGLVAIVNGEPITYRALDREVRREIRFQQIPEAQRAEATRQLRPLVLNHMIDQRLIQQECDRRKLDPTEEMVERFLRDRMAALRDVSSLDEYFSYMFRATGDDEEALRKQARQELRRILLFQQHVYRKEYISPRELREYYRTHQELFREATRYKLRYLTIPKTVDIAEKAAAVQKDLADGVAFETLIERYGPASDRGNSAAWEVTDGELDQMLDPIPRVVRELEVGAVSPPLEFPTAVRYIRLEEKKPGRALAFDTQEAQEMIANRINNERRRKQAARFIEELREREADGIERFLVDK
ncbi:MAG: peptidylprolyl isomerase [Planctomycetota bacterium]